MFYFARRTKTGGRIVSHDAASSCALSDDRHVPATEPPTWTGDRTAHVDPTG